MPHGQHTSIGFLSLLIAHLESNPHPPTLTRGNPLHAGLVCAATHLDLPWYARAAVKGSLFSDIVLWALNFHLKNHPIIGKLIGTTQAFTLSSGGNKVNVCSCAACC
jgi:Gly-Xaa carboxypeptidase